MTPPTFPKFKFNAIIIFYFRCLNMKTLDRRFLIQVTLKFSNVMFLKLYFSLKPALHYHSSYLNYYDRLDDVNFFLLLFCWYTLNKFFIVRFDVCVSFTHENAKLKNSYQNWSNFLHMVCLIIGKSAFFLRIFDILWIFLNN